MINQHSKYRPDIDGLRAIAILPVVLFHAFPSLLPGGFVGVDVFFVISGFLISSIIFRELELKKFSFLEFYSRRVRRLFPALSAVLGAVLLFGWFALDGDEYQMLGKHAAAGAGFVQNFVLWQEVGYFDVSSEIKPLLHLWSLAIEEQFYLFFPLIVWCAWRFGVKLLSLVLWIAGASLIANLYWVQVDAVEAFYFPHTRFWELMAGAILAAVALKASNPDTSNTASTSFLASHKSLLSIIGLLLILLAAFALDKKYNYPGWRAIIPVLGATLIIYAGRDAWVNRKILSNKVMIFIGLISYPLYLWHWPLLSFARIIEPEALSATYASVLVILSFILAILTYYLIEKPIRSGGSQKVWTRILVGIMAVICAYGLLVNAREITSKLGASDQGVKEWTQSQADYESYCAKLFPEWNDRGDHFNCSFLRDSKPEIAVIGDSHSRRIHYGISHAFGAEHNIALFPIGCAMPFYDISVAIPERQRRAPDYPYLRAKLINQALNFSIEDPAVKLIVLSTGACWHNIVDIKNLEDRNPGRIVENKMRETFERLTESGKEVIYVLDNPILDFDPKACLTRPFRASNSDVRCKITREAYEGQRVAYFNIARRVLAEFPNIRVFDVADVLCDEEYCHAVIDNKLMYHDPSHLGYDGSQYVGEFMVPMVNESLGKTE